VEKIHLRLAEDFAALGHDVAVISRRFGDLPSDERIKGVRHLRVPSSNRVRSTVTNFASDLRYSLRVRRLLPASDITVTNSFFLPLTLSRASAGKIYMHVARFPKHQMFLYRRADRQQAVSETVARAIVSQAPHLAKKVVSIGYPVAEEYFRSTGVAQRSETVLFAGRIAREKGVHVLLRAFRLLTEQNVARDWKLRVVGPHEVAQGGDGLEYLNELKSLAEPLGRRCEFSGPIFDEARLIAAYQSASVFVYPSLAEKGEAFGLAPLEAMAAGCAVIVSNLPCFGEFVEDGRNAVIFDHSGGSPEQSLAQKIQCLVRDHGALHAIARNGVRTARKFSTRAIAARMLEDFETLLRN